MLLVVDNKNMKCLPSFMTSEGSESTRNSDFCVLEVFFSLLKKFVFDLFLATQKLDFQKLDFRVSPDPSLDFIYILEKYSLFTVLVFIWLPGVQMASWMVGLKLQNGHFVMYKKGKVRSSYYMHSFLDIS